MIVLPPKIADTFDAFLVRKSIPENVRFFHRKWLRFYWDFCHKYQHDPFRADSLPLFLQKLQDQRQSEQQQKQAHHAVSWFYEMQTATIRKPINTAMTSAVPSAANGQIGTASPQALPHQSRQNDTLSSVNDPIPDYASNRVEPGSDKVDSTPTKTGARWVFVFDRLLSEIKIRHYSPKTLKAYRGWAFHLSLCG